jgi:hypothetical protein
MLLGLGLLVVGGALPLLQPQVRVAEELEGLEYFLSTGPLQRKVSPARRQMTCHEAEEGKHKCLLPVRRLCVYASVDAYGCNTR